MNFDMSYAPGAGSIARPVDLQSSVLQRMRKDHEVNHGREKNEELVRGERYDAET